MGELKPRRGLMPYIALGGLLAVALRSFGETVVASSSMTVTIDASAVKVVMGGTALDVSYSGTGWGLAGCGNSAEITYSGVDTDGGVRTGAVLTSASGEGTVKLTLPASGRFTLTHVSCGSSVSIDVVVEPQYDLSEATVVVGGGGLVCDGTAKTPPVMVRVGDEILQEAVHYTVTYAANTNVGTAEVWVTGLATGYSTGTAKETFTILDRADYPAYIDVTSDDQRRRYEMWRDSYGVPDVESEYEAQFLLNVAPDVDSPSIKVRKIEMTAEGLKILVGSDQQPDMGEVNGTFVIFTSETLDAPDHEWTSSNVSYGVENGEARIVIPEEGIGARMLFIKVVLTE